MKIKHLLKTPTMLVRPDRTAVRVGGPHCVRECGQTGQIWVALKGSIACHPGRRPTTSAAASPRARHDRRAQEGEGARVLQPELLRAAHDSSRTWATTRRRPRASRSGASRRPRTTRRRRRRVRRHALRVRPVAADDRDRPRLRLLGGAGRRRARDHTADPSLLHIDARTHATRQVDVPHPPACCEGTKGRMTGPAIVTAPDGAVWCSLLSGDGAFVRTCPRTGARGTDRGARVCVCRG